MKAVTEAHNSHWSPPRLLKPTTVTEAHHSHWSPPRSLKPTTVTEVHHSHWSPPQSLKPTTMPQFVILHTKLAREKITPVMHTYKSSAMIHPVEYKKSTRAVKNGFFVFRVLVGDWCTTGTAYERSGMGVQLKHKWIFLYKIQSVIHKLTQMATTENI